MNTQLGEKIRTLRKSRNLSQEVLAQYLGISFQAVSKRENHAGCNANSRNCFLL